MALYLGNNERRKIILNNNIYFLNFFSETSVTDSVRLVTLDGHMLQDLNGLYLIIEGDK